MTRPHRRGWEYAIPCLCVGLWVYLSASPASAQTVIYCAHDAAGAGTGGSWEDACTNFNTAYGAAAIGKEIWVKAGTYVVNPRITLKAGVAVYGGFTGNETKLTQRDWATRRSVLDGADACQIFYGGASTITATCIVDGMVLQNGYLGGNGGGAVQMLNGASPLFRNCVFQDNQAARGGAIYSGTATCSPEFVNCQFTRNHASNDGGAVGLYKGDGQFVGCEFTSNTAKYGSVYLSTKAGSDGKFINCLIHDNPPASNSKDVMRHWSSSVTEYYNCTLEAEAGTTWLLLGSSTYRAYNSIITGPCGSGKTIEYSRVDVGSPYAGAEGNITADPLLDADYRLTGDSPCRDVGNNSRVTVETDKDGNPRIAAATVDMGCFEYRVPGTLLLLL